MVKLRKPTTITTLFVALAAAIAAYVIFTLVTTPPHPLTVDIEAQEAVCIKFEEVEPCAIAGRAYKLGKYYSEPCEYVRYGNQGICRVDIIKADAVKAQTYLEKACRKEHFGACALLAELYLEQEPRDRTDEEIRALALDACDRNKGLGCAVAARLLGNTDPAGRSVLSERACDQGYGDSCYDFAGYVLNNGRTDARLAAYYAENKNVYDVWFKEKLMALHQSFQGDSVALMAEARNFATEYDGEPYHYLSHHDALMEKGCALRSTMACSFLVAARRGTLGSLTGTFDNDVDLLSAY